MRFIACLMLVLSLVAAPVYAQQSAIPDQNSASEAEILAWQSTITGQLEALRAGDGEAALGFAAVFFKTAFPNPSAFYAFVIDGGYKPLVESSTHTFGEYALVDADTAWQQVTITGPDHQLFIAIYQLTHEEEGWRVAGVTLSNRIGMAI